MFTYYKQHHTKILLKQNPTCHSIKKTNDAQQINKGFIYSHVQTWCINNFQEILIVQKIWNHKFPVENTNSNPKRTA